MFKDGRKATVRDLPLWQHSYLLVRLKIITTFGSRPYVPQISIITFCVRKYRLGVRMDDRQQFVSYRCDEIDTFLLNSKSITNWILGHWLWKRPLLETLFRCLCHHPSSYIHIGGSLESDVVLWVNCQSTRHDNFQKLNSRHIIRLCLQIDSGLLLRLFIVTIIEKAAPKGHWIVVKYEMVEIHDRKQRQCSYHQFTNISRPMIRIQSAIGRWCHVGVYYFNLCA